MALVQNTNVSSLLAQHALGVNTRTVQNSLERLASGFRINRAADDATAYTISENLIGEIRSNNKALQNAQDGVSLLQIADGALSQIGENLQRIRELVVQGANDTMGDDARNALEDEIKSRLAENNRIAGATSFNGVNLLDGSVVSLVLQIGPNSNLTTNTLDLLPALQDSTNTGIGLFGGGTTFPNEAAVDLIDNATAQSFLADLDAALTTLNQRRASNGSLDRRLTIAIDNLQLGTENSTASNSRIRDVDVAKESSTLTQYQILQQASVSVLAQSNQIPKQTLDILLGR